MDATIPYICIDQITPFEAAIEPSARWQPGDELHVAFLEGTPELHRKVAFYAHQWEQYANIAFLFDNRSDAQIRIAFQPGGSWSMVGKAASSRPRHEATMNFGWLWRTPIPSDETFSRVVLHEFGHALGLIHEHQTPTNGIQWNKDNVIEDVLKISGQAGRDEVAQWVEENIFQRYTFSQPRPLHLPEPLTPFDPHSIMLYRIPKTWTLDGFETPWNSTLSQRDKDFIRLWYPR